MGRFMFTFTILLASLVVIIISIYMMYHLWQYAKNHMEKDQKAADKIEAKDSNL
jgi:cell division protein FtsL